MPESPNGNNPAAPVAAVHSQRMTTFGGRVRGLRTARGWTSERLAPAGVGPSLKRGSVHGRRLSSGLCAAATRTPPAWKN
jgi:hypothetical protein